MARAISGVMSWAGVMGNEAKIINFTDINFTVIATAKEYCVDYLVYEIVAYSPDNDPLWQTKDSNYSPNPCSDISNAEVFINGSVKWDGCSNWYFDEQERGMIHGCNKDDLTRIGHVMGLCWDMTSKLCPNWFN